MATIFLDNFNGSEGTLLTAHVSDSGHSWDTDGGNLYLDGDGAVISHDDDWAAGFTFFAPVATPIVCEVDFTIPSGLPLEASLVFNVGLFADDFSHAVSGVVRYVDGDFSLEIEDTLTADSDSVPIDPLSDETLYTLRLRRTGEETWQVEFLSHTLELPFPVPGFDVAMLYVGNGAWAANRVLIEEEEEEPEPPSGPFWDMFVGSREVL